MENNADHETGLIDLPLLLIDDEADNASVNTNSEEKDPTAINQAIRNILNCFRQASYLGITATPFANIFIDPDTDEATRDLFPKDFLTVLPTPDLYIGADKIFGSGDADEWDDGIHHTRTDGIYGDSIIPIQNEEQESFYIFKHRKELANELYDLPESMKKAIRYFILACTISDIRQDNTEHRSMLVNVSRFTKVQNITADLIEAYVASIKADLENYSALSTEKAMQIKNIAALYAEWEYFQLEDATKITWESFLRDFLLKSAKRIEVRSVNQQHGASSLNYYEYKDIGMRVIAVGGNSLSRGLTLEGLCVSYFYRNTMMYDTLLQMGRWFGYRPNYDDLFKVWMAEDAIDWYGYITDAINELKDELRKMKRQNQTPEDFGLKVRQAPGSLLITARNKMRTATSVKRPITVSGRMIETPRLKGDAVSVQENEELCRSFIKSISIDIQYEYDNHTKAFIWRNVPKKAVIEIVRNYITHPWNLNFQPAALAEYIAADESSLDFWDVAIPQDSDTSQTVEIDLIDGTTVDIHPKGRPLEWDSTSKNMLKVYGRHVRIGSGGCTKIGLSEQKIKDLREEFGSSKDSTYLHTERNPLLLIHILRSFAVSDYLTGILTAPENDYVINSDVLCAADYGAPQKRMRFVVIGIKRSIATKIALPKGHFDEDEYRTVRDAIEDLETVPPVYDLEDDKEGIKIDYIDELNELAASLRNNAVLKNHIITKTTDTAMQRFKAIKQGQNFHSLDDKLKTNTYTDASRTQNTIYLRLDYDEPSGTVVNVRKSMWIHPTLDRAISVREAARLQTFPDSFVFCGSKDKQYQQVGNAVPPIMAKSIAKKLAQTLNKSLLLQEKENG